MRRPRSRRLLAAITPILALAVAATSAQAAAGTVHIRGTAYEFNSVHTLLSGATIKVAEYPALSATAASDGTYDLAVPDKAKVTPYIVAAGHHTIYLQTFTTNGVDLKHVNFQTPSDGVAAALTSLLGVPHDADGYPTQCVVVSTFNTKNVRDVDFDDFTGYGAHGVAGATASTSPALPAPTYFNEHVIPDPLQKLSSKDGGVIWTEVPTGTYTVSATSPTTRFASFVATCKPGRIVNANPPWGLHELASTVVAKVTAKWGKKNGAPVLTSLKAKAPFFSTIKVSCTGPKCFKTRTLSGVDDKTVDLRRLFGGSVPRVGAGQTLQVAVSDQRVNTKVVRWMIGKKGTPKATELCIPLGDLQVQTTC